MTQVSPVPASPVRASRWPRALLLAAAIVSAASLLATAPRPAGAAPAAVDGSFVDAGATSDAFGLLSVPGVLLETSLAVGADGSVTSAGVSVTQKFSFTGPSTTKLDLVLRRRTATGALDTAVGPVGEWRPLAGTNVQASPLAMRRLADGTVVVVAPGARASLTSGEPVVVVVHLRPDGTPDTTWAPGGLTVVPVIGPADDSPTIAFGDGAAQGAAAAIGADGTVRIAYDVNGGQDRTPVELLAIGANGRLDHAFGNGGWSLFTTSNVDDGLADLRIALDGAGRTVAMLAYDPGSGGSNGELFLRQHARVPATPTADGNTHEHVELRRFSADGRADATFGTKGVVDLRVHNDLFAGPVGLALLPGDAIAVAADAIRFAGAGEYVTHVLTFDAAGTLRTGFGHHGETTVHMSGGPAAGVVAAAPDGSLLLGGAVTSASAAEGSDVVPILTRLTPAGAPDATFDTSGRAIQQVPALPSKATSTTSLLASVAVGPTGRIATLLERQSLISPNPLRAADILRALLHERIQSQGVVRMLDSDTSSAAPTTVALAVDGRSGCTKLHQCFRGAGILAVHGTVRDAAGAPVAGAPVELHLRGLRLTDDDPGFPVLADRTVRSAADGTFDETFTVGGTDIGHVSVTAIAFPTGTTGRAEPKVSWLGVGPKWALALDAPARTARGNAQALDSAIGSVLVDDSGKALGLCRTAATCNRRIHHLDKLAPSLVDGAPKSGQVGFVAGPGPDRFQLRARVAGGADLTYVVRHDVHRTTFRCEGGARELALFCPTGKFRADDTHDSLTDRTAFLHTIVTLINQAQACTTTSGSGPSGGPGTGSGSGSGAPTGAVRLRHFTARELRARHLSSRRSLRGPSQLTGIGRLVAHAIGSDAGSPCPQG